jgi:hypothetical protein
MFSTESPPLNDVLKLDFDDEYAPSNGGGRLKPGYRSSGFKNAQFKSDKPSIGGRLTRSVARLSLAVLIGVGATLAWQSYGGEAVRTWAPSLSWLLPASTMEPPAPAVTSTELQQQLQQQLRPMAIDLALVRRSEDQLAANQDQLARKQDQMAQAIAALQAAEQEVSQKISSPPTSGAAHVPPPKPLRPAAQ